MATNTQKLHNIGIIAHVDAGKTTLTERMLYYTGQRHKIGDVHHGNCATDSSAQEQAHGITIQSAAVSVSWPDQHGHNRQINLIDTPGHVDFNIEVQRALRVLDGAVVVLDAVAGVEPQTEANWRLADQYQVPRLVLVNKMDRAGANYAAAIAAMTERLGATPLLRHWPIMTADRQFIGLVDLLTMESWLWTDPDSHDYQRQPYRAKSGAEHHAKLDAEHHADVIHWRDQLVQQLAEEDDRIMTAWLDGQTPSTALLMSALRQACLEQRVVPVLCGSAFRNQGVQPLLDTIVQCLPCPDDLPAMSTVDNAQTVSLQPCVQETFTALVFKLSSSQHGRLAWLRCYSGHAATGDKLLNSRTGKTERLSQIYRMHADQRERLNQVQAGDIVAVQGLKNPRTGDTLCMPDRSIQLERITVPEPVMSVAVEARNTAELEKLLAVLRGICLEDPSLQLHSNEQGQTLLSGMGELQMQMLIERIDTDFGLTMHLGKPQVSYRERLVAPVTVSYVHKKQDGGAGQWAKVELAFSPIPNWHSDANGQTVEREPVEFVNRISGGHIPQEFIPAVANGIRKAATNGTFAGYPCEGMQATLLDGDWHSNDSSALAFEVAASQACKQAMQEAKCQLMEPIMAVQISSPLESLGDCIGDLNRRRGLITQQTYQGELANIEAHVPLIAMFGYINDLRSLSAGRAQYSMTFSHYEDVPPSIAETLIKQ